MPLPSATSLSQYHIFISEISYTFFFFKESIMQISVFLFKLRPCTVNAITNKVEFAVACFLLVFHTSYVVHSVLDVIPFSPCFLLC